MHQPERLVERADLSNGGCATPCLHFVCILGKRHALRIRNGRAVIEYEIGSVREGNEEDVSNLGTVGRSRITPEI